MNWSSFKYLARQGLHSMVKNRLMSVASIGVLTVCLLITGVAGLFTLNVGSLMDYLGSQNETVVYLKEDLTDEGLAAVDSALRAISGLREVTYVSKEEALERMKESMGESAYLPHNCIPNSIIYTGTHDTPTFVQWLFSEASPAERDYAFDYLRLREDEGFGWGAVCGAWAAPARLAIAPFQDLLGLGGDARINTPGTMGPHNWSWRVRAEALNPSVSGKLAKITRTYRR